MSFDDRSKLFSVGTYLVEITYFWDYSLAGTIFPNQFLVAKYDAI